MTRKLPAKKDEGHFTRGDVVIRYEFRILNAQGRTARIWGCEQASDFVAVRWARAQMPPDGGVEVWRGMECIYVQYQNGKAAP